MNDAARQLIARLQLTPLAGEGGFFRQTWRNETASAILYLMTPADFSALHRLRQDELWHFHAGDPCEHVQLDPADGGRARVTRLGPDPLDGDVAQVLVPAGTWQGARVVTRNAAPRGWSLLGCTVSPPWDERSFALGARAELLTRFPAASDWIQVLTR